MDRYTAGISACYSTSAVSVSTGNPSGGISGQHNYIAGILVPLIEGSNFQVSAIEPFGKYNGGKNENNFGCSSPQYYKGEAKDCYWSGTGPSAGIGKVEGASPVNNQNTGCTQFLGTPSPAPSGADWGSNYWKPFTSFPYKLYWE
jgi:hypothetical protein